jgi:small subunit ribosomal protein S7e
MASKIIKAKGKTVSTVEENVAKALTELQGTNELKALENLHFVAAKEIDVAGGKKAIIVFTPYRLHKKFQALQPRLGRELEKKFANTHFVFIAQRTILSTSIAHLKGIERPRSRTLTAVHAAILDDIVFPSQIVGKRTRVRTDQTKLLKVFVDKKDAKETEDKLKSFAAVYNKLTHHAVEFSFPIQE